VLECTESLDEVLMPPPPPLRRPCPRAVTVDPLSCTETLDGETELLIPLPPPLSRPCPGAVTVDPLCCTETLDGETELLIPPAARTTVAAGAAAATAAMEMLCCDETLDDMMEWSAPPAAAAAAAVLRPCRAFELAAVAAAAPSTATDACPMDTDVSERAQAAFFHGAAALQFAVHALAAAPSLPMPLLQRQPAVRAPHRTMLSDWLVGVTRALHMSDPSLHLAVRYVDGVLATTVVPLNQLQLLGATAVLVASKVEETFAVPPRHLAYLSAGCFSPDDILAFEHVALRALGFRLLLPTVHSVLCALRAAAGPAVAPATSLYADFLADSTLYDVALTDAFGVGALAAGVLVAATRVVLGPAAAAVRKPPLYSVFPGGVGLTLSAGGGGESGGECTRCGCGRGAACQCGCACSAPDDAGSQSHRMPHKAWGCLPTQRRHRSVKDF
jgi:hypothetical protein